MKIVGALLLAIGISSVSAVAADTTTAPAITTGSAIKANAKLQNQLKKAQDQLQRLQEQQSRLMDKIKSEIDKAINNDSTKVTKAGSQIDKAKATEDNWQTSLDKMAANDKIELDNLNSDIQKMTDSINKQIVSLNSQLTNVDAALANQLASLEKKLAAAKDDSSKNSITAAETAAKTFAGQKKDAINAYLTLVQADLKARQAAWDTRKDLLTKRQAARTTYRTTMTAIDKAVLDSKIETLSQVQSTPTSTIQATVTARYQKQLDTIQSNIDKTNATIAALKTQLNK